MVNPGSSLSRLRHFAAATVASVAPTALSKSNNVEEAPRAIFAAACLRFCRRDALDVVRLYALCKYNRATQRELRSLRSLASAWAKRMTARSLWVAEEMVGICIYSQLRKPYRIPCCACTVVRFYLDRSLVEAICSKALFSQKLKDLASTCASLYFLNHSHLPISGIETKKCRKRRALVPLQAFFELWHNKTPATSSKVL